jgi:hypothetical protein
MARYGIRQVADAWFRSLETKQYIRKVHVSGLYHERDRHNDESQNCEVDEIVPNREPAPFDQNCYDNCACEIIEKQDIGIGEV